MPTKRDILQAGTYYHIYQRGNNKGKIFLENRNYAYFLQLFAKHLNSIVDTYAYCLLANHFHFLIRIRDLNQLPIGYQTGDISLSQPFSNWLNAYSKSINKAYNRTGHLFEERFKRKSVRDEFYLINLVYYIHANPQKHGLIKDFRQHSHSSFRAHCSDKSTLLKRNDVWDWFNGKNAFIRYHQDYHEFIVKNDWG